MISTLEPEGRQPRERVLTTRAAAIWRACRATDYGRIIKLLILLGSRRAEIGGIALSELDLEQQTVNAARCKRSKNGERPHVAADADGARHHQIVPRRVSRDQLFGVRAARRFTAWGRDKSALDERSGEVTGWCLHDLRRTAATRMGDPFGGTASHHRADFEPPRRPQVRRRRSCNNKATYEREVRNALALWSDHIRTLVEGGERKVLAVQARCHRTACCDAPDTF